MFCSSCGAAIPEGAKFCAACGQPQAVPPPAPPAAYPPPPPAPETPFPVTPPPYAPPPYPQVDNAQTSPPGVIPAGSGGAGLASWGDRAVGYIIDSLIVGAAMLILYLIAGAFIGSVGALSATAGLEGADTLAGGLCCLLGTLFPIATLAVGIYNRVYLVAQRGYSIGQGVMKLKVIDANGNKLRFGTALLRLIVQLAISLVPLGGFVDLLWPLWDAQRQTLHDKAVGSFVVYNR